MLCTKIGFVPSNWESWNGGNWAEGMRDRCVAVLEKIPGIDRAFSISTQDIAAIARKYLLAVKEAGAIYRHVEAAKGREHFITEVSIDETDAPQTPVELFFILAAVADQQIPAQTAHQLAVLAHAEARESVLLISPTGTDSSPETRKERLREKFPSASWAVISVRWYPSDRPDRSTILSASCHNPTGERFISSQD